MELTGDSPAVPAYPLLFPRAFLCQKHSVSICSAAINQKDTYRSTGQTCAPWDQGAERCLRQCSAPECGSFIFCLPTAWWGSRWQFSELLGLSGSFRSRAEQPETPLHPCVVPEGPQDWLGLAGCNSLGCGQGGSLSLDHIPPVQTLARSQEGAAKIPAPSDTPMSMLSQQVLSSLRAPGVTGVDRLSGDWEEAPGLTNKRLVRDS